MARTRNPDVVDQIAEAAHSQEERPRRVINPRNLYPTGSTMLNLACSDHHRGGYNLGTIVTLPGASAGGKTMLAMSALAEGVHDPRFDEYEFVYDDAESAMNFDVAYLFGRKVADRVVSPPLGVSRTIQTFKSNMLTIFNKNKKKCIYCLDSLDSLASDEELEKEMKKALAAAKSEEAAAKIAGSFGMEKAKIMGQVLRMLNDQLESTDSLLLILQQLRQNTNAMAFGNPWCTSGGEAPFFYSSHQIWLSNIGQIKKNGKIIGGSTKAKVVKNKFTGKKREVCFNIYPDYGLDNIGSMVDWLISEKLAKESGKGWKIPELEVEGTRPKTTGESGTLVERIEDLGLENELSKLVGAHWVDLEENLRLHRKPRFGEK